MFKVSKSAMAKKLLSFTEQGLTNAEIAVELNAEYGATGQNKLNAIHVGKLKAQAGVPNSKPKKKPLIFLVDDEEEGTQTAVVVDEVDVMENVSAQVDEETGEIIDDVYGAYTEEEVPQEVVRESFSF